MPLGEIGSQIKTFIFLTTSGHEFTRMNSSFVSIGVHSWFFNHPKWSATVGKRFGVVKWREGRRVAQTLYLQCNPPAPSRRLLHPPTNGVEQCYRRKRCAKRKRGLRV